jgi:hypothetical protein
VPASRRAEEVRVMNATAQTFDVLAELDRRDA